VALQTAPAEMNGYGLLRNPAENGHWFRAYPDKVPELSGQVSS
jgi:hypothetical protein